jgi:hypothetical protein
MVGKACGAGLPALLPRHSGTPCVTDQGRRFRSPSDLYSRRSLWGAWDQGALALSGGVLAAPWSFNRCFSANVSAAILFEKVARTGPLLSPSFTAKNAPSWVTTYVAITPMWHRSLLNTVPSRWIEDKIYFPGSPPALGAPRTNARRSPQGRLAGWLLSAHHLQQSALLLPELSREQPASHRHRFAPRSRAAN